MFPSSGQRHDDSCCTALNYIFMTLASQTVFRRAKKTQKCFHLFIESSEESALLHQTWMLIDQLWTVVGSWGHDAPWQNLLYLSISEKDKLEAVEQSASVFICGFASKVPESERVLEGQNSLFPAAILSALWMEARVVISKKCWWFILWMTMHCQMTDSVFSAWRLEV